MKILILGVSGFIGQKLYRHLSKKHVVHGVSRTKINLKNCISLDLLNSEDLINYFDQHRFDAIINLASKMASVEEAKEICLFTDNVQIQTNLIRALKDYKKFVFINFSSSAVYPNITGIFSEESKIDPSKNPDCLYGLAKFNSEVLFSFLLPNDVKLVNLRVGYVYGDGMNKTRIHKVFEKELENKNEITVFSKGERVIPQIKVENLIHIVELFVTNPVSGTYNVADENTTLYEIAQRTIDKKGNNMSIIRKVSKGSNSKFNLDIAKLKSYLKSKTKSIHNA